MKSCNEVVNDLLERRKIYKKKQQQKRRILASVSCCLLLCLVVMKNGNEGISHRFMQPIEEDNDYRGRVPIYMNEIEHMDSPAKLFFDPEGSFQEKY